MDDETREILTSRAYEALAAVDRAGRNEVERRERVVADLQCRLAEAEARAAEGRAVASRMVRP